MPIVRKPQASEGERPDEPRPGRVDPAFDQGGGGEGIDDREADIAEVEDRRVDREARVLKDRVQVAPLERGGRQALERVRGQQDEQQEGGADQALHGERVGPERPRQGAAEHGDHAAEDRQDQHPQQHRAFVVSPDAGELVDRGRGAVRVLRDVEDREVGGEVGVDERGEGDRDAGELGQRRAPADRHQLGVADARAPGRDDRSARALRRARGRGRNGRSRQSLGVRSFLPAALLLQRFDDLARHVALVVLGEDLVAARAGPGRRARPRPPRPDPRGKGRECCRSRSRRSRPRRSSSRRSH